MKEGIKKHPWRSRLIVGLFMLILAFVGLIITDISKEGAWEYWRAMTPIYALLSIGLSLHLRKNTDISIKTEIWQEILHWSGLIGSVYLISSFVNMGFIGRFEAGLVILVLLSLATFLAGIYHDFLFFIIGLVLASFSLGAAFLNEYLWSIMLPLTLVAGIVMAYMVYRNFKANGD